VSSEELWAEVAKVAEAFNLLGILAAPRLRELWCAQAPNEALYATLQSRMETFAEFCAKSWGSPDADLYRSAAPLVRSFAEALADAPLKRIKDPRWESQARECLSALGIEEPPGGWESFEGWPTDEKK
jgi:hypothetical protein